MLFDDNKNLLENLPSFVALRIWNSNFFLKGNVKFYRSVLGLSDSSIISVKLTGANEQAGWMVGLVSIIANYAPN